MLSTVNIALKRKPAVTCKRFLNKYLKRVNFGLKVNGGCERQDEWYEFEQSGVRNADFLG
jgi:hypothetical protein